MPGAKLPVQVAPYLPNQLVTQSATVVSNSRPIQFTTNFLHLFRHSALLECHTVRSSVAGPPRQRLSAPEFSERKVHTSTNPISLSVEVSLLLLLLLLLLYCCYCCQRLEALRDAPCASLALPVVRWLRLSFRSRVPKPVFQVAVAQAEVATPNRCCSYLLPGSYLMPVALEAALPSPSGRCLLH